jgi:multidrug efflux system membrane fusion protein
LWIIALVIIVVIGMLIWHPWRHARPANGAASPAAGAQGGRGGRRGAAAANQPQSVRVAAVTQGDIPIVLNALGTVTPFASVIVRTQLNGTLVSVGFKEGQLVKKGDFLAQIDPRPYQISLENAQGSLARDQALLKQARSDLARYQILLKQDSVSSQQVDTQASLVDQYKGTIKSDQANIDTFKLDLIYCRIVAPISGRVGLRQVDPGNYVTTGDAAGIVVLTQLDPISVVFAVPEDNLPQITKRLQTGATLSASAYDRSNTTQLAVGSLQTLDNQIDTTTGTLKLRAGFDNRSGALFPNQFVNVRLLVDVLRNAAIVPTSAIQNGSAGPFVYLVKPGNTVTVRQIKAGPVDGERTSVLSGVAVGDTVVTDGTDRLREGAKITTPAQGAGAASGAASGAAPASAASSASAANAASAAARHGHRRHAASAAQ